MKLLVTNPLGKGLGLAGLGFAGLGFAPVAAGARLVTDAGTGAR
jgi:hypothetical protein